MQATELVAQSRLSEVALFHRCFAQLTQQRASRSDPLLAAVRAGTKTALQACTELLDRARFSADGGTKIQNENDPIAKAVLSSLHQLHRTWSRYDEIFDRGDANNRAGTMAWYEDSPVGAYITRALFSPNFDVTSVVKGRDFLQAVRTTMDPPHSFNGIPDLTVGRERLWRLGEDHPFAPRGDLLGIRSVLRQPIDFFGTGGRFTTLPAVIDFSNLGVPPAATTRPANINYTSSVSVQGPLTETDQFAIRLRGTLHIPSDGSYTLYLNSEDGGILLLNGERYIARNFGEGSATLTLSAGTHALEVRYRQGSSAVGRLIMSWAGPGFAKQVVPASAFSDLVAEYYTGSKPYPFEFTGHEGGGFMGSHNYFLTSYIEANPRFIPDGALNVNRSWARAVLSDALCREVPVVREDDVASFVIPDSEVPFRQAAGCTACHASLDRQAGVIRGLRYSAVASQIPSTPPSFFGMFGFTMYKPGTSARSVWEDKPDPDYALRDPQGRLFFRNYRGELIDRTVNSIEELGAQIAEQDDFYACFAKRYYSYFMGIEIPLGDPGDPTYPALNQSDLYHKNQVIELGRRLKNDKSLRQLILNILASEDYARSDSAISRTR